MTDDSKTEHVWRPHAISVNGEKFLVELEPRWRKAYDLAHVSIEAYHSDLRDPDAVTEWPDQAEVQGLLVLCLTGYEKTIKVTALFGGCHGVVPDEITVASFDVGRHKGGVIRFEDTALHARVIEVIETQEADQQKIQCARRALRSGAGQQKAGDGSNASSRAPALEGKRYRISGDFQTVMDKKENATFTDYLPITAAALEVMVARCPSRKQQMKGHALVEAIVKHCETQHGSNCRGYTSLGEMFRISAGQGSNRKDPLGFYGKLVKCSGPSSMYWLDVD